MLVIGCSLATQPVAFKTLTSARDNHFMAKVRSSFSSHFSHNGKSDDELIAKASVFNIGLNEDGLVNLASLTNFSNAFNQDSNGLIVVFDFETAFNLGLAPEDIQFQCFGGVKEYCYNHYVPVTTPGNEYKFAIAFMFMSYGFSSNGAIEVIHTLSETMLDNKCFGDMNNFDSVDAQEGLDIWECFKTSFNQVESLKNWGFNKLTELLSDYLNVYQNEDGSYTNDALDFMASKGALLNPYTGNMLEEYPPIYSSPNTGPIVFNDAEFVAQTLCQYIKNDSAWKKCLTPNNNEIYAPGLQVHAGYNSHFLADKNHKLRRAGRHRPIILLNKKPKSALQKAAKKTETICTIWEQIVTVCYKVSTTFPKPDKRITEARTKCTAAKANSNAMVYWRIKKEYLAKFNQCKIKLRTQNQNLTNSKVGKGGSFGRGTLKRAHGLSTFDESSTGGYGYMALTALAFVAAIIVAFKLGERKSQAKAKFMHQHVELLGGNTNSTSDLVFGQNSLVSTQ